MSIKKNRVSAKTPATAATAEKVTKPATEEQENADDGKPENADEEGQDGENGNDEQADENEEGQEEAADAETDEKADEAAQAGADALATAHADSPSLPVGTEQFFSVDPSARRSHPDLEDAIMGIAGKYGNGSTAKGREAHLHDDLGVPLASVAAFGQDVANAIGATISTGESENFTYVKDVVNWVRRH